ncbi:GD20737 [Drosophila simulans]|uniref:GD20737 n=1 Tax=Drosophila simulans TaxID=7240 RepID=B4NVA7_DROSI|nr:GD20737 [Drosophila simulans]
MEETYSKEQEESKVGEDFVKEEGGRRYRVSCPSICEQKTEFGTNRSQEKQLHTRRRRSSGKEKQVATALQVAECRSVNRRYRKSEHAGERREEKEQCKRRAARSAKDSEGRIATSKWRFWERWRRIRCAVRVSGVSGRYRWFQDERCLTRDDTPVPHNILDPFRPAERPSEVKAKKPTCP